MLTVNWKDGVTVWATRILRRQQSPGPAKELAWRLGWLAAKCGRSNPVSFILRPIAGHKKLRAIVGVNMAILAVLTALLVPIVSRADRDMEGQDLVVSPEGEASLTTTEAVRLPVENYRLSQGYWLFHPGIDMATGVGEPVRPVMAGRVVKTEVGRFGYGNNVVVDHGGGYTSLYAHLSKIEVAEGDEVETETEIGQVGSTGRSTGPHLHLEVRQDGKTINPKAVVEIK